MRRSSSLLLVVAALLISAAAALPLWRIDLIAPQYPEGLGMLIRINTIEGVKENDLESINGLNHYIGMARIEPGAIPELRWMPTILAGLILSTLVVALWRRRSAVIAHAILFASVCGIGLYDFWLWGYRFGHQLDAEHAIIKIPGMSYQPPLIGSKQLLNFTATSWPASGGWALIAAAVVIGVVLWRERTSVSPTVHFGGAARALGLLGILSSLACADAAPRAIELGTDRCEQCGMTISDVRFGGAVVSTRGRTRMFDSVDCLVRFVNSLPAGDGSVPYVIDLQHPGTLIPARTAAYLRGSTLRSPMGESIVAFIDATHAEEQRTMLGGRVTSWTTLAAELR
ncbi:MAG: nitrous oxide reductase accessory protein NosL [Gemmatimonadaceae bacterium]|nr:nitrous oxide reductase accessory protein NosL [Gemmatimonadaceae bacterium]